MRPRHIFPGFVVLAFAIAAPSYAVSVKPAAGQPASADRVEEGGPGQESQQVQKEPEGKKKKGDEGLRFVWADRPSLRAGRWLRVDFRLKMQVDARRSQEDLTERGGTVDLRLLRGGVRGEFLRLFEFQIEHDLRSGGKWRDTFLNYRPLTAVQIRGGKFKVPFSLEQTTGVTDLDFIYRSLAASALSPGRDVGAMAHGSLLKQSFRYEIGYFRGDGDSPPAVRPMPFPLPEDAEPVQQPSLAGRIRAAPFRVPGKNTLFESLEIGVAATSTTTPVGPNHLQGQSVLGVDFFPRTYYVNGPRRRLGAEFSWSPGPASIKFEYIRTTEARLGLGVGDEAGLDNDLPDLVARGWYATGTWVITGEKKDGGVVPRKALFEGGIGAIEVAGRYEGLRFASANQTEPPSSSPRAATVEANGDTVVTAGVNWYLNRWVKIQANVIRETFADATRGPTPGKADVLSYVLRVQFVL